MTVRLRATEIARLRSLPGHAAGLFITDRCPVGCAHCSVDSRADSPRIRDFELLKSLVDGLALDAMLEVVAITGGEPLVERKGVELSTSTLRNAGKRLVLFTSGVWAGSKIPSWISAVLHRIDTVFLSTDQYHETGVGRHKFIAAARAIAQAGCWIVVQTINRERDVNRAEELLLAAFEGKYLDCAEIVVSKPLSYGRGDGLFAAQEGVPGHHFGACGLLGSPLVRYDGRVTACCNERVIMGHGSSRLARKCESSSDLRDAFDYFKADPLLNVIGNLGFPALLVHPKFSDLGPVNFPDICQICRMANNRVTAAGNVKDPLLMAIAAVGLQK